MVTMPIERAMPQTVTRRTDSLAAIYAAGFAIRPSEESLRV